MNNINNRTKASNHSVQSDLVLFNSIGAEIERVKLKFHAKYLAMKRNYAIAASHDKVFIWKLKISQKNQILNSITKVNKTIGMRFQTISIAY